MSGIDRVPYFVCFRLSADMIVAVEATGIFTQVKKCRKRQNIQYQIVMFDKL